MRTIKELLEVLLENQECFDSGLCLWATTLRFNSIINYSEYKLLCNYIKQNRPSMFSSWDAFKHRNKIYYWEVDNIKPRIKWIKEHIKLNS